MRLKRSGLLAAFVMLTAGPAAAAVHHAHPSEALGAVDFRTTCDPSVRASFNRAAALLHSFVYVRARAAFTDVLGKDPHCAMALWGRAMTHYHPLWEPQVDSADELSAGRDDLQRAAAMTGVSPRERQYITALQQYYLDTQPSNPAARAQRWSKAMADLARDNPRDDEAQIFYALSLIATGSPSDKTHADDLRAAAILEPMWRRHPKHPGVPHYLIHAYDSPELARRGLAAARAYSKIAPSAPHALHMPAHIFTRLGLWRESALSNQAARTAARDQGDIGEELHAMDYLTYALLQLGRLDEARKIVAEVQAMAALPASQLKVGYAANAMPVRLAVESGDWNAASRLTLIPGSPTKVAAIVDWARALGHSRGPSPSSADADIDALAACAATLRAAGDAYWAVQADVMLKEAQGWRSAAQGQGDAAIASLRAAADEEDELEKLPLTPGPIVPAREQLGTLLLQLRQPAAALAEFRASLRTSPGRRGALLGEASAKRELRRRE